MDITLKVETLATELGLLLKVISSKPKLPILASIKITAANNTLQLFATDHEVVSMLSTCDAQIAMAGTVVLPAKRVFDLVSQCSDDVQITLENAGTVRLSSGKFASKLQTYRSDDFPPTPTLVTENTIVMPSEELKQLLVRTRYAITEKPQKYVLNGALFICNEHGSMCVATDGKRLSLAKATPSSAQEITAIIPKKTIDILKDYEFDTPTVNFSHGTQSLFFVIGRRTVFSRMLDGQFPDYLRMYPDDNEHHAVVERAALAAALRRVGQLTDKSKGVIFHFTAGQLALAAASADAGSAHEPLIIGYSGPEIRVCANWQFMLDFLDTASGQTVDVALKDSHSRLLLTDGKNFSNVIMTMKV